MKCEITCLLDHLLDVLMVSAHPYRTIKHEEEPLMSLPENTIVVAKFVHVLALASFYVLALGKSYCGLAELPLSLPLSVSEPSICEAASWSSGAPIFPLNPHIACARKENRAAADGSIFDKGQFDERS
jgi:hypothetical protein